MVERLNYALAALKTPEIFFCFPLFQMLSHHVYENRTSLSGNRIIYLEMLTATLYLLN